ncbi:unnamed protein product [Sphagnum compactum]
MKRSSTAEIVDVIDDLVETDYKNTGRLQNLCSIEDHVVDIGALDEGYSVHPPEVLNGDEELKSKATAFDIRAFMRQGRTGESDTAAVPKEGSLVRNHVADISYEACPAAPASSDLFDCLRDVCVDSLYAQLLSQPLAHYLALNQDQHHEGTSHEPPVPLLRFLDETQYIRTFEHLLLLEVSAALSAHLEAHPQVYAAATKIDRSGRRRGGDRSSVTEQVARGRGWDLYCTSSVRRERPAHHSFANSNHNSSSSSINNGSSIGDTGLLMQVVLSLHSDIQLDPSYDTGTSTSTGSGAGIGNGSVHSHSKRGASPELTWQVLSSHPHVTAIVLTTPRESEGESVTVLMLETSDGVSSAACSRHLSCAVGGQYSVLPLLGLCSFVREWAALHSLRDQRVMPLAPYLLKAAPVASADRLE